MRGRTGGEPPGCELVDDVSDRVVARCIEFEGEFHERRTLRIDLDPADVATVADVASVNIPDRGAPDRLPSFRCCFHLALDVRATTVGGEFVEDGDHSAHRLASGGVIDRLGDREQLHAERLEYGADDGVFPLVSCRTLEVLGS